MGFIPFRVRRTRTQEGRALDEAERQQLKAASDILAQLLGANVDEPGHEPVPSGDPNDVPIDTPEGRCPLQVSWAIRTYFPSDQIVNAARVSYYESAGWNPKALNDTLWRGGGKCGVRYYLDPPGIWAQTEYSVGLFQINVCAHGGDFDQWANIANNVRKAAELYRQSGWHPWSYTGGQLGLI